MSCAPGPRHRGLQEAVLQAAFAAARGPGPRPFPLRRSAGGQRTRPRVYVPSAPPGAKPGGGTTAPKPCGVADQPQLRVPEALPGCTPEIHPSNFPFFFEIKAESGDGLSLAAATITWRGGREGDTRGCHQAVMPQFWGTSAPYPRHPICRKPGGGGCCGCPHAWGGHQGVQGGVQRAWP